jgi:hypothetical protein
MKHDESALVKQALRDAREQLAKNGRLLPSAYMLVRNNPQTGAPLANPTALAWQRDAPFASRAEYQEFLAQLRSEIARLAAVAVAIGGEAEAEVESAGKAAKRRVYMLRVEDRDGVEQLHAPIEADDHGELRLGKLLADAGAEDILTHRFFE